MSMRKRWGGNSSAINLGRLRRNRVRVVREDLYQELQILRPPGPGTHPGHAAQDEKNDGTRSRQSRCGTALSGKTLYRQRINKKTYFTHSEKNIPRSSARREGPCGKEYTALLYSSSSWSSVLQPSPNLRKYPPALRGSILPRPRPATGRRFWPRTTTPRRPRLTR